MWFEHKIYLPSAQIRQENNEFKNHLSVWFVRGFPCPSFYCCLHAKILILLAKSCIPSILIDPESMEFSTIEKYQISDLVALLFTLFTKMYLRV